MEVMANLCRVELGLGRMVARGLKSLTGFPKIILGHIVYHTFHRRYNGGDKVRVAFVVPRITQPPTTDPVIQIRK